MGELGTAWVCLKSVHCARPHIDENYKTYFILTALSYFEAILTALSYFEVQVIISIWRHKYHCTRCSPGDAHPPPHDLTSLFFYFPNFFITKIYELITFYSPIVWVKFDLLSQGLKSCTLRTWDLIVFALVFMNLM